VPARCWRARAMRCDRRRPAPIAQRATQQHQQCHQTHPAQSVQRQQASSALTPSRSFPIHPLSSPPIPHSLLVPSPKPLLFSRPDYSYLGARTSSLCLLRWGRLENHRFIFSVIFPLSLTPRIRPSDPRRVSSSAPRRSRRNLRKHHFHHRALPPPSTRVKVAELGS
jgi:hypothetical protein